MPEKCAWSFIVCGTYRLESIMYSLPAFEPEMAELYMRILDHPLEKDLMIIKIRWTQAEKN